MPNESEPNKSSAIDIFQILSKAEENGKRKRRAEFLASLGMKELFIEGSITIDKNTCKGLECKLCIKACPTNVLYWKAGELGITHELCIYCGACVWSCIVDDCIKITRKRETGEVEKFSKPEDFTTLQQIINAKKRRARIQEVFPKLEDYLKQYRKSKS